MKMVDISKKRYTTKHYDKNKKIPKAQFDELCTVLQNAPSSLNGQPWHFLVVNSDELRQKMLPAVHDFNWQRITDPSHVMILCVPTHYDTEYLKKILDKEDKDGRYLTPEDKKSNVDARIQSFNAYNKTPETLLAWQKEQAYIALGQLLFAAAGMDIDSTAIGGFDRAKLDELLNLKEKSLKSVCIIALGYRIENDSNASRPKSRLSKEQLFTFL